MRRMLTLAAGLLALAGCAAPVPPNTPLPPPAPSATSGAAASAPLPPVAGLRQALALVSRELDAAHSSADLPSARGHAQLALNALVGTFGRWYAGDRGDVQGVLPAERVPAPAPDVGTPIALGGWALLAYDAGNDADKAKIAALLGDQSLWRSNPRRGYDAVAAALTGASPTLPGSLRGALPRLVAYARLIVLADSKDRAAGLASAAVPEAQAAVAAVAGLSS